MVYENDNDFGDIDVIPLSTKVSDPMSPSQKIDRNSISHLGNEQQTELLAVLDRYPECYLDVPGLKDVITHSIPFVPGFKPKRLHAYRVPERLKPEVDTQIQEMLDNGIIRPSRSPMAGSLVCVLKGKKGWDTSDDAYQLPDISSVFQRIGRCNVITFAYCKAGYWQISMLEEDKWLTAFVCDAGLFDFNGAFFGLKGSGNTFVRAIDIILSFLRKYTGSFVDDVAVHSHQWKEHMNHLYRFLAVIKKYGIILSLKKCRYAQSQVNFCGEITGSGKRFTDPGKLQVM